MNMFIKKTLVNSFIIKKKTNSNCSDRSFLGWVARLSLRLDICRARVEPNLLCIERSYLWWFGHLIRMPPGHLPFEVFWERPTVSRPWGRARTCWRGYISHLAWQCLRSRQTDARKDIWNTLVCLLPPWPDWMDGWMDKRHSIQTDINTFKLVASICVKFRWASC